MIITIYGRPGCPFCVRAKQIAEKLAASHDDISCTYIDMYKEGISKEDLAKEKNIVVNTVPQVFVDQNHIGGCDDFVIYVKENLN